MTTSFSTSQFTHNKASKTFSAELSDLQLTRLPKSIMLASDRTNELVEFKLNCNLYDEREGELYGWEFIPVARSIAAHPQLAGYTLVIYND